MGKFGASHCRRNWIFRRKDCDFRCCTHLHVLGMPNIAGVSQNEKLAESELFNFNAKTKFGDNGMSVHVLMHRLLPILIRNMQYATRVNGFVLAQLIVGQVLFSVSRLNFTTNNIQDSFDVSVEREQCLEENSAVLQNW